MGHAHDAAARTGVTVILPDAPAVCAVDVRGEAPGARETDALAPDTLVDVVDALVFSGGSVYGLAAADGVAAWLGAQGRGFALRPGAGVPPSPSFRPPSSTIWPTAARRRGGCSRLIAPLGITAAQSAAEDFALGSVGAGYGAAAGALKGGIGSASALRPPAPTHRPSLRLRR